MNHNNYGPCKYFKKNFSKYTTTTFSANNFTEEFELKGFSDKVSGHFATKPAGHSICLGTFPQCNDKINAYILNHSEENIESIGFSFWFPPLFECVDHY